MVVFLPVSLWVFHGYLCLLNSNIGERDIVISIKSRDTIILMGEICSGLFSTLLLRPIVSLYMLVKGWVIGVSSYLYQNHIFP